MGGWGTSNTLNTFTIGKLRKSDPTALPLTRPITRSQTLSAQSQIQGRNNLVSEPRCNVMDQQIERMEKEISSLGTMEERIVKRIEEMVAALHNQLQNSHAGDHSSARSFAKNKSVMGSKSRT